VQDERQFLFRGLVKGGRRVAKFFQTAAGAVGLLKNDDEVNLWPRLPAGATNAVDFDESTNAQHIADFDAAPSRYAYAAGALKKDGAAFAPGADGPRAVLRLSGFAGAVGVKADRSTASAAYVDIPDLAFQLDPNTTYAFDFLGAYTAAAATTGVQLALNGPASPAVFGATFEVYTGAAAVLAAVAGAYDAGVNGTASGGATPLPFRVSGVIKTGASGGALTLRGRSEAAGSAVTVKQGSYGRLFKAG
jgi:hypothetical protein